MNTQRRRTEHRLMRENAKTNLTTVAEDEMTAPSALAVMSLLAFDAVPKPKINDSNQEKVGCDEPDAFRGLDRVWGDDSDSSRDTTRAPRGRSNSSGRQPPLSGFAEWHNLRAETNLRLEQQRRRRRSKITQRFMST